MEDWSLQAVVGGCNNTNYFINSSSNSTFGTMDFDKLYDDIDDDHHNTFLSNCTNELEDLYKPFYPLFREDQSLTPILHQDQNVQQVQTQVTDLVPTSTNVRAAKYKRRKNQQKRVVIQVKTEDLSSDVWAWRKYGQKPIKGSPYPRSYYRCSSSKGCLARKQVEQSFIDPGMFIITYTAEHSHTQPTRRNSLAGTNRNKQSSAKAAVSGQPIISKPEEEIIQQRTIKQEARDDIGAVDSTEFDINDVVFSDDFFAGLEDLGGFESDPGFCSCSHQQFPATFCS
jgi:WRKY transcription factor 22